MGLLARLSRLVRRHRNAANPGSAEHEAVRHCHFEQMEARLLLSADPLRVGAVYVEEDSGSDLHGDTFYLSFEGALPARN